MVRKVTFTFDDLTIRKLENAAQKVKKPKSEVVRQAIADYHDRIGRLSESERLRLLKIIDEIAARPVTKRSRKDVDREIVEIRTARRGSGRRHPS
ncbi:MAG TPA: ribbon-helix-helix protein, CopG family [Thermoanaerobaculia bacterium]|jgi:hypothetical protein|nr:ribbon-helix-helix protein, CopG family [Thermoanaerobaculia bacterium]